MNENSRHSQLEHELASSFDEFECGRMKEMWLKLQTYMMASDSTQYWRAFNKLERVHVRLRVSTHHPTLFARFHALLTDFCQTVKMSPEEARIMRLSSTRATTNSFFAFQWRIQSLMSSQ